MGLEGFAQPQLDFAQAPARQLEMAKHTVKILYVARYGNFKGLN